MSFWKKYKWTILILLFFLLVVWIIITNNKKPHKYKPLASEFITLALLSRKKKKELKKHENKCRQIFESLYGVPFKTIRPDFLKYENGRNLELDGYNQKLNIAFEYQGKQHREYTQFFHKSESDFIEQVKRDKWKAKKCKQLGINLITIPDTVKIDDLKNYIQTELIDRGLL